MNTKTIGRNEPCPCGSGKKYKQCCQGKENINSEATKNRLLESIPDLFTKARQATQNNNHETAEKIYKEILDINPKHTMSLNNLGLLSQNLGKTEQAIFYLEKLVKLEPSAQYYTNLARSLMVANRNTEAIEYLKKAVSLNPGDYLANNNLGLLFCNLKNYKEGIPYLYKATNLNPTDYLSLYNLGVILTKQGKHLEAGHYYRRALATKPNTASPYQNYLYGLCFDNNSFPDIYLNAAKELENFYARYITPYKSWHQSLESKKSLKIGIVSGDLRTHAVSYFLQGVIENIDKNLLQLFAYHTTANEDSVTEVLKPHFFAWHNIAFLSKQQAAEQIYKDEIDILIDLSGHTHLNGLEIFAYKPAPIQISWLGYWASTGLSFIDYFIADEISIPLDKQCYFSEQIYYLPDTRLCFTPPAPNSTPTPNQLPALKNGFVTFGCFQNYSKINPSVLQTWAKILSDCPNSKLFIKNGQMDDSYIKADFLEQAKLAGISLDSLIIEGASDRYAYFESYHKVDIILDTFPYPGGTTTC